MIKGSIVAIITPFKNNKVDYEALEKLIEFHIQNGTGGIVPCGTTGESATLTHLEHKEVIDFTIKKVKGRILVIAGTGSNSTQEAIELAESAKKSGADAHLSITPYYNKPTQEGLYLHFKAIAEAVNLPMVMYNVPGRTGVNMLPETAARLSQISNIAGIKEATGDLKQITEVMELSKSGFILLSGDDFTNLAQLAVGSTGAISVTANIAPKESASLYEAFAKGDLKGAQAIQFNLQGLHRAMFIETSPIPVKTAAHLMGLIPVLEFRLPLCPLKAENEQKLKDALKAKGFLR
jgi:4-hydroxy-tetrahydrodipicolinate synthase